MSLIRWEPANQTLYPLRGLHGDVDQWFDEFFRGWANPAPAFRRARGDGAFLPTVDLKETQTAYVITAALPGITKDQLDVKVADDRVTLKGERRNEAEHEEGESYHYRESTYGAFERVVPLPGAVETSAVEARLRDGVLTLTLPKLEKDRAREIPIEVD